MIEKYFKDVITVEEIKGHFNKNFKVETKDGFFHLKIKRDSSHEINKWIEGNIVKEWNLTNLKQLKKVLENLNGTAPIMFFGNVLIKDQKFYSLLDKYKHAKKVYCHNDINKDNVVIGDKMHLIDFEFARMNHPYWEWANIINEDSVNINLVLKANKTLDKEVLLDWIYINKTFNKAWNEKYENKVD